MPNIGLCYEILVPPLSTPGLTQCTSENICICSNADFRKYSYWLLECPHKLPYIEMATYRNDHNSKKPHLRTPDLVSNVSIDALASDNARPSTGTVLPPKGCMFFTMKEYYFLSKWSCSQYPSDLFPNYENMFKNSVLWISECGFKIFVSKWSWLTGLSGMISKRKTQLPHYRHAIILQFTKVLTHALSNRIQLTGDFLCR